MPMKSKYASEYLKKVTDQIYTIIEDNKEWDDWTQICLSVQDAIQAATSIFGFSTDEEKHNMNRFLQELLRGHVLRNLTELDIHIQKQNNNG